MRPIVKREGELHSPLPIVHIGFKIIYKKRRFLWLKPNKGVYAPYCKMRGRIAFAPTNCSYRILNYLQKTQDSMVTAQKCTLRIRNSKNVMGKPNRQSTQKPTRQCKSPPAH